MSRVYVLDRDTLAIIGLLEQSYTSLTYTRRYQAMDSFQMTINRRRLYASELQKGRLLYLPDEGHRVFLIEQIETIQEGSRASDEMTVSGRSLEGISLVERIVLPPGSGEAYDEQFGETAETAMKHFVDAHAASPVDTDRAIPNLVVAADAERGVNVDVAGRFQTVFDMLVKIGYLSGLGWEIVLDTDNSEFVFDVLEGVDRSASVFFDFAFETLEQWEEMDSALDSKTWVVVAGQGEGVDRDLVYRGSGTGFERREAFVDARDVEQGNTDLLASRGDSFLAAASGETSIRATLHQFGSFRYLTHWDLGDIVLVRNEERGIEFPSRVIEVSVTVDRTGAAPTIVATLGRPYPGTDPGNATSTSTGTADSGGGGSLSGLPAGGVLSGTYPDPGFAVDMATQAELDAVEGAAVMDGDAAGGDLSGTYPNPSVVDSSHNHNAATAPGVADTAGPDANITVDAAGAAGTSGTRARAGHGHQVVTSSATPLKHAATGSAGSTGAIARASHVHPYTIPVVRVYTSGATWTKPAGLVALEVEVLGPGGGGGGAPTTGSGQCSIGSGGGGGGYARKLFAASALPASCTVTIGTGGTGTSGGDGNDGSAATTFAGTGITTVSGGAGGGAPANAATSGNGIPAAGAGGTASGGDINIPGGPGQRGVVAGGSRTNLASGAPSLYGYGGNGSNANGSDATGYGAGGGGASNSASQGTARAGGAGSDGLCIVTEWY